MLWKQMGENLLTDSYTKISIFNLKRSCGFKIFRSEKMGVVGAVKCSNEIAFITLFCNRNTELISVSNVRPQTKIPYCRNGENKEL